MREKKLFLLVPAALPFIPAQAHADKVALGVYPPIIRVRANPKATVKVPFTVTNFSDTNITTSISLRPFQSTSRNDGSIEYYATKDIPTSESNFLNTVTIVEENKVIKSINLYPNESKKLEINYPAPETSTDHYFSIILASTTADSKTDSSVVRINSGIALNVLTTVEGSTSSSGSITELEAHKLILSGPAKITLKAANESNTFENVSGVITIYNMLGEKVGSLRLKQSIILANDSRYLKPELPQTASNQIEWNNGLLFGVYKVKAVVQFDQLHSATAETHFVAIPLLLLLITVVALFIVLSIVFRTLKKLNFKES